MLQLVQVHKHSTKSHAAANVLTKENAKEQHNGVTHSAIVCVQMLLKPKHVLVQKNGTHKHVHVTVIHLNQPAVLVVRNGLEINVNVDV